MRQPTVIACFRSHDEAIAAERALTANGIVAGSGPRNAAFNRVCPDLFPDGFDVFVDAADAARGIAIVQHLWPDDVIDAVAIEPCPACGSTDTARLPRVKIFIAAAVVLFAAGVAFGQRDLFLLATGILGVILLVTPNRRCRSCGERWRR